MGYYLVDGTYQCTGGPDSPVSDEDGGIARRAWTGAPAGSSPIRFFDFAEEKRVSAMQRERDELLAALKGLVAQDEACEKSLCLEYGKPYEEPDFDPSSELAAAHALIARIEKP